MMKTIRAGIIDSTTPASTVDIDPVPNLPCRLTRPSGRVKFSLLMVMMSGRKNSFQMPLKARIPTMAMPGVASGR